MASRVPRILWPLRQRDFALLAGASAVSLFGDGFFYVALAWQVYEISNVPSALSVVGLVWTLPMVLFLLVGGVASDRFDRRTVMIGADLLRAAAVGGIGVLSAAGVLELWHVMALIPFIGLGDAFFNPASSAIVPDLLGLEDLPQANALSGAIRPLMLRLLGPAFGGVVVAVAGPGTAFLVDAATFMASAAALAAIRARPAASPSLGGRGSMRRELGEGIRHVRANPWLWATLVGAGLCLLVYFGPMEVLLPFVVKNELGGGPGAVGLLFAAGGVGAVLSSLLVGRLGIPRRHVTAMYASWAVGSALVGLYGVVGDIRLAYAVSFVIGGLVMVGQIVWSTLMQRLVPRELLGRVSSVDWLVSTALIPASFALTGPVAAALGASTTLLVAGPLSAVAIGVFLFVPGCRDPERAPPGRASVEGDAQTTPSSASAASSSAVRPSSP